MTRVCVEPQTAHSRFGTTERDRGTICFPALVPAIDSTGSMLEGRALAETAASTLKKHVLDRNGLSDQYGTVHSQSDARACAVALAVLAREATSFVGTEPSSSHLVSHELSTECHPTGAPGAGVRMLDHYCLPLRPDMVATGTNIIMTAIQAADVVPVAHEVSSARPSLTLVQPSCT